MAPLAAQEPARVLLPGPGVELTSAKCGMCHELTHITRARLSRGEWEDNVKNMIERGAPIAPAEIKPIVEYLATYYNRDAPPPAAGEGPPPVAAAASGDPERLLAAHACMGCHTLEQNVVGPSFKAVAGKYRGDPGAEARVAAKIRAGGAGVWGAVPMPPHPQLSETEAQQLAAWVLSR